MSEVGATVLESAIATQETATGESIDDTKPTTPAALPAPKGGLCQVKQEYRRMKNTPLDLKDVPGVLECPNPVPCVVESSTDQPTPTPSRDEGTASTPCHDARVGLKDEKNHFSNVLSLKELVKRNMKGVMDARKRPRQQPAASATERQKEETVTATPQRDTGELRRPALQLDGLLYLSPLTTVGNLPFRRVCKLYGADITCGEMAVAQNLLKLQRSEWSLLRKHESEGTGPRGQGLFAIQIATPNAMEAAALAEVLNKTDFEYDIVDLNCGCPIDVICRKGCGSSLLHHPRRIHDIVQSFGKHLAVDRCSLTIKVRVGIEKPTLHKFIGDVESWGVQGMTIHGRTQRQRYTREADWDYIRECAKLTSVPVIGNGDIYSFEDYEAQVAAKAENQANLSTVMIGRGALMKPWIFQEIKERRHIDISSHERLEMLRTFVSNGLSHWGSDARGVETTRRYLLEWLSFLYRYVPIGLLEQVPSRMNERAPFFVGRNDLETLMGSEDVRDWVRISEMLLGKVPNGFTFTPKHKSNSYTVDADGNAIVGNSGNEY